MIHVLQALVVVFGAFAGAAVAAEADPEPRVVLIERNPWLMVVGSDSPSFALYSDGLVIFKLAGSREYVSTRLDLDQRDELLGEIAPGSLLDLDDSYVVSDLTDMPINELHVWVEGRRKSVSVYGNLRINEDARAKMPASLLRFLDEMRPKTPAAFLRAFDAMLAFSPDASPWLPDRIEVLIWPYEYSPEEPLAWPAGWPGLESARSRPGNDLQQLFLPSAELPELERLLRDRKPKQAIELGGRKWAISYRLPFPNEAAWAPRGR